MHVLKIPIHQKIYRKNKIEENVELKKENQRSSREHFIFGS